MKPTKYEFVHNNQEYSFNNIFLAIDTAVRLLVHSRWSRESAHIFTKNRLATGEAEISPVCAVHTHVSNHAEWGKPTRIFNVAFKTDEAYSIFKATSKHPKGR